MLDDTGLIHMNGRIFDPRLARFMQADPFIQAAANTQSYNRYSYVINNPLNATDPSGYLFSFLGKNLHWKIYKAIGYDASQILVSVGSFFCGPYVAACAAVGTYDLNRAFGMSSRDSLKSAVFVGISAAAFQGIGSAMGNTAASTMANRAAGVVASGVVGGIMAELQGGKFGNGFIAAGLSAAAGAKFGDSPAGFVAATVIGGTVSEMTGGKFANGAATAAFSYAMSWAASKYGPGGIQNETKEGDIEYFDESKDSVEFTYEERVKLRNQLNAQRDELNAIIAKAKAGDASAIKAIKDNIGGDLSQVEMRVKELSLAVDNFETYKFQRLYSGSGGEAAHYDPNVGVIRISKTVYNNVMSGRTDYSLIHEVAHYAGFEHYQFDNQKSFWMGHGGGVAHARSNINSNYNYKNPYAYQSLLERY